MTTEFHCYRLGYRSDYDSEAVWELVQRHGGFLSIRVDVIDFWIAPDLASLLVIAYPDLERRADLDYV
jgi:hypothetical protein